jgi:predicted phage terminase large subunit-like protein
MAKAAQEKAERPDAAQVEAYSRTVKAAERMLRLRQAQTNFISFAQMMMPDLLEPEDHTKSRFQVAAHHRVIADALEKVQRGEILRLCISLPPRHGKTEMATRMFPAWFLGKNPYSQVILAGASGEFAESEFGRKIKAIVQSPQFKQVFPLASLGGGSKAVGNIVFKEGGNIKSIGKGAQVVGRGADLFVLDDPYANAEEAESPTERKKLWEWFTSDAMSRLMPGGRFVIIHQRFHEDDVIGRLTDPKHPNYDPEIAAKWTHLNLPAVIDNPKLAEVFDVELKPSDNPDVVSQFGLKPIAPLWPDWYGLEFFAELKRQNAKKFSALYMGNPAPEDGDYFKKEWLVTYKPDELPVNLRKYSAGDFAVSTAQSADETVVGSVGVDDVGDLWILPEIFWGRHPADETVDGMVDIIRRDKPIFMWAENGHISKSIGPFLNKRLLEEQLYCAIIEMTPSKDKQTRARSIQGRMAMRRVHFPEFAWWWEKAKQQLLKFPAATHDDFVDFISWIGIGLGSQVNAARATNNNDKQPESGTLAWVKMADQHRRERALAAHNGGF